MTDTQPEVTPHHISGLNMSLIGQLQGLTPKFTIVCGHCHTTFRTRTALHNNPATPCPRCNTINRLPLTLN